MTTPDPRAQAEAAWAEHSIGFTWRDEEQRYGEHRAFLAGRASTAQPAPRAECCMNCYGSCRAS